MHHTIDRTLATDIQHERIETAAARRAVRAADPSDPPAPHQVVIRRARPSDSPALERVAQMDADRATAGRLARLAGNPSEGSVLVAEVEGDVTAGVVPADGTTVADPFRPTAGAVELLRLRVEQLAGGRPRRRLGFAALRPRLS